LTDRFSLQNASVRNPDMVCNVQRKDIKYAYNEHLRELFYCYKIKNKITILILYKSFGTAFQSIVAYRPVAR
jgi:hypothetical protein